MQPNPYESPNELTNDVTAIARHPRSFGFWEGVIIGVPLILVAAASIHATQIQDLDTYRVSPIILVEILGMLASFAMVPLAACRCLYFLIHCRFLKAALNALLGVLAIFVTSLAGWIDSPTLIYAT